MRACGRGESFRCDFVVELALVQNCDRLLGQERVERPALGLRLERRGGDPPGVDHAVAEVDFVTTAELRTKG